MSSASPPAVLTDDDSIRSHPERVANQISDRDVAATFDGRRPGLQTDDVGLGESQLGGVLDGDEAFLGRGRRTRAQ
jgi:hypothetical protein